MEYMFHSASSFTGDGIENFVTTKLLDIHGAFFKARALKEDLDLSGWDVSKVTDFSQTFYGSNLVSGNIGAWNTTNGLTMQVGTRRENIDSVGSEPRMGMNPVVLTCSSMRFFTFRTCLVNVPTSEATSVTGKREMCKRFTKCSTMLLSSSAPACITGILQAL